LKPFKKKEYFLFDKKNNYNCKQM